MSTLGYPDGYQDPPYDGTVEDFGDNVIPARMEATLKVLNENLSDWVREAGLRFEWVPLIGFTLAPAETAEG